ncbi:UPF0014 family [Syncephalastrum racemosum]|uniref:UPF0014 family n=1 Tax=Syncephalastrum racemosum TaxID=13706 RepID=A0A1X2HBV9_SYNRA|nr:UPF0014 family [Syncephalastrum racemosum]
MDDPSSSDLALDWWNVAGASIFVIIAVVFSRLYHVRLEQPLIVSSLRCVVQLTLMGLVLDDVLHIKSPWSVLGVTVLLVLLGAYETVYHRSGKMITGMVLKEKNTVGSLGILFALKKSPFWEPTVFVPVMGMLLGNSMASLAMASRACIESVIANADILETRLAFGASRFEAVRMMSYEPIRLAMLPCLTQLSVMGMINIPGLMTGQILAGTPIRDAVIYQQCIMFMVTASCGIGALLTVWVSLGWENHADMFR